MTIEPMSWGRIRAIQSYHARGLDAGPIGHKVVGELLAEVQRLRAVLAFLARANPATSDPRVMAAHAAVAICDPDLGKPDFICTAGDMEMTDQTGGGL